MLAWAYELTPHGIRREPDSVQPTSSTAKVPHMIAYAVAGGTVLLAIALLVVQQGANTTAQASVQTLMSRPSVMVLPFTNVSGDENQEYRAFGLTDELIAGLGKTRSFPVISRDVSYECNDTNVAARECAKSFGVSYLLEGNISIVDDSSQVLATPTSSEL